MLLELVEGKCVYSPTELVGFGVLVKPDVVKMRLRCGMLVVLELILYDIGIVKVNVINVKEHHRFHVRTVLK